MRRSNSIKEFRDKFVKKYNYVPDHNGMKGYLAIYMIKAATEKMGKVDSKASRRCAASAFQTDA